MHEFDSGDRNRRTPKSLEPKHGAQTKLDGSMVLFDQIIEVLRRPRLGPLAASMCGEEFPGRAVRRLMAVKCDRARQSALTLELPLKKCIIVVCARLIPRSAIISTKSRKPSLNLKYQRTQRMMISRSKWRPLKSSSMLSMRVPVL
jgi:hypothetical protein